MTMASRRATATLAQAVTRSIPARVRPTTAQFALRQYHGRVQQQRQLVAPVVVKGIKQSAGACNIRRSYSTESETKEAGHKIWNFEAVKKLTSTPKHSVTIVDVREPHELQQTGKIPGAINVPITSAPDSFYISEDEFEDRFGYPRPAKDAEVIFYCRSGVRSRAASELAKQGGWTNVGEYPGSWLDWSGKGGDVER